MATKFRKRSNKRKTNKKKNRGGSWGWGSSNYSLAAKKSAWNRYGADDLDYDKLKKFVDNLMQSSVTKRNIIQYFALKKKFPEKYELGLATDLTDDEKDKVRTWYDIKDNPSFS